MFHYNKIKFKSVLAAATPGVPRAYRALETDWNFQPADVLGLRLHLSLGRLDPRFAYRSGPSLNDAVWSRRTLYYHYRSLFSLRINEFSAVLTTDQ